MAATSRVGVLLLLAACGGGDRGAKPDTTGMANTGSTEQPTTSTAGGAAGGDTAMAPATAPAPSESASAAPASTDTTKKPAETTPTAARARIPRRRRPRPSRPRGAPAARSHHSWSRSVTASSTVRSPAGPVPPAMDRMPRARPWLPISPTTMDQRRWQLRLHRAHGDDRRAQAQGASRPDAAQGRGAAHRRPGESGRGVCVLPEP